VVVCPDGSGLGACDDGGGSRGAIAGLSTAHAATATMLLDESRTSHLRAPVATLAATRTAAVNTQQRDMRRIERDLHDGAQARLVALSVELGLAEESFDNDPAAARQMVARARDEATRTLVDLRDLVRGIGPPILIDGGLVAALESLAAGSPIPVTISAKLRQRLPAAVETAAYLLVSECLTNAAEHSRANQIKVAIEREHDSCVVTIRDDGIGGAHTNRGGLSGLADRLAAVDGTLAIVSPSGGPTNIRAELPCAQ
jgi:signal transduction histidine kinase